MKKHLDFGRGVFCEGGSNGSETDRIEDTTCLDCLIELNKISSRRYDELWGEIDKRQGELFVKRLPRKPVDLREGSEGGSVLDKAEAPVFALGVCRICGEWTEGTKQTLCWNCGSTGKE